MSFNNDRDARVVLMREKYFSLRPKPLERWLWQQGLPQAAERVFWLHWEQGMRRRDWCSELSLKEVARECCIDPSTVTRAYQLLRRLGLIRREDPGRDPDNPFQQAIAITEVRVPRELLVELGRAPNRAYRPDSRAATSPPTHPVVTHESAQAVAAIAPASSWPKLRREETTAVMRKLSDTERTEFHKASRDRQVSITFDAHTALNGDERGRVLEVLRRISEERPLSMPRASAPATAAPKPTGPRRISPLEAARVRRRLLELVPGTAGSELFRQIHWSMEEGALRRFEPQLAANIALKKVREGLWTRPNRMPPQWLPRAAPEACGVA
jgi:predicted transcriptional regulator